MRKDNQIIEIEGGKTNNMTEGGKRTEDNRRRKTEDDRKRNDNRMRNRRWQ